jgi:hypothetical protein
MARFTGNAVDEFDAAAATTRLVRPTDACPPRPVDQAAKGFHARPV